MKWKSGKVKSVSRTCCGDEKMFTWEKGKLQQLFELINNSCWKWQGSSVSDNWVWSQDSL